MYAAQHLLDIYTEETKKDAIIAVSPFFNVLLYSLKNKN